MDMAAKQKILIVDDDKDSSAAAFNVTQKLKGVIHAQSN